MAKGSANERTLGSLHSTLTKVFTRTLERYLTRMDNEGVEPDADDLDDEMADAILVEFEPNPAMLSAISKFLKDNDVLLDTEELDQLSAQDQRLKEMRQRRGNKVVSIASLAVAE